MIISTKKSTGSYYTPSVISEFIVSRVFNKHSKKKLAILEPSAGDGVFIRSIYGDPTTKIKVSSITAIEISTIESKKIRKISASKKLNIINDDFLLYQDKDENEKFDVIIGNPPYIKKNLLSKTQIDLCQHIHALSPHLSKNGIKNIWSSFLVKSLYLLKSNGILSFVLPAELLQVKYTAELRELLVSGFSRIEIFTFNELLFKECKGQDTIILIAEKNSNMPGLFFHNVMNTEELLKENFPFSKKEISDNDKWTSHCLNESEISLLKKLKSNLKTVGKYSESKAGIVTGANDFFILNSDKINEMRLNEYSKPIIQKGSFVKSWIKLTNKNYDDLVLEGSPCYLIDLNNAKTIKNPNIKKYLTSGVSRQINARYKTMQRGKWYEVPGINPAADALFFKRCHEVPKFIINEAKLLATDSAYLVNANDNIDIKSLVLSFYNSLTLIFSELNGRFYGGGVLELTPNEFKSLPIPYVKFSKNNYTKYTKLFNSSEDISSAIREIDKYILKKAITDITDADIENLEIILKKLVARRTRL